MPIINFSSDDDLEKYAPDQPRDKGGKFSGSAGSIAAPAHEGHWDVRNRVKPSDVISVTDAVEGAKLLDDGKFIKADIKTTHQILENAAKSNSNADLTNIEIAGTKLMTQNNIGIPRKLMPQVDPENKEKWLTDTRKSGLKVTEGDMDPAKLKPVQSEMSAGKVGGIMGAIESGKMNLDTGSLSDRIIVSRDGYVIDGHHRWAAAAMVSLNTEGGIKIPILKMDCDYKDALDGILSWNKDNGIKLKDLKDTTQKALMENNSIPGIFIPTTKKIDLDGVLKYAPGQPHDSRGRFSSGGGGMGMGPSSSSPVPGVKNTMLAPRGVDFRPNGAEGETMPSRDLYLKQDLGSASKGAYENIAQGRGDGTMLAEDLMANGSTFPSGKRYVDVNNHPMVPDLTRNSTTPQIAANALYHAGAFQGIQEGMGQTSDPYLKPAYRRVANANQSLVGYRGGKSMADAEILAGAVDNFRQAASIFEDQNYHQDAESAMNIANAFESLIGQGQ